MAKTSKSKKADTIFSVLVAALGAGLSPRAPKDTDQDYIRRIVLGVGKLSDDEWEGLPEDAQEWYNSAAKLLNSGKPLPLPPGFDSGGDDGGDPEEEETPEEEQETNDNDSQEEASMTSKKSKTTAKSDNTKKDSGNKKPDKPAKPAAKKDTAKKGTGKKPDAPAKPAAKGPGKGKGGRTDRDGIQRLIAKNLNSSLEAITNRVKTAGLTDRDDVVRWTYDAFHKVVDHLKEAGHLKATK